MTRFILGLLAVLLMASPVLAGKKLKLNEKEKEFLHMVDYLITNQERKEFNSKTTHYERDQYIELFWAKRDSDLTDNVNTFRTEWLARFDYAKAHFKDYEFRQTSMNQTELFLLLGPPKQKSFMVDISLVGAGYRNRYLRYPPELWTYDNPGFDFKRRQLKVQFVPTSAFGEYVALTDQMTEHFLRNLKYRLLVNPELEEAPLNPISSADYQVGGSTDSADNEALTDEDDDDLRKPLTVPAPRETPAPDRPVAARVPAPKPEAPAPQPDVVAPSPAVAVARQPAKEVKPADPPTVATPPPVNTGPATSSLAVPSTLSSSTGPAMAFDRTANNHAGLDANTGYFKSGADKRLLLGRVGFPLNNVEFAFVKEQFVVPFQLDYRLVSDVGVVLHSESYRTEVSLPSKSVLQRRTTWFSREFAVIAPGDRYRLESQLTELNSGRVSFWEQVVEVPPLREEPQATALVFMDPNVSPEFAKFNIAGKPYNLMLGNVFAVGERMFPVTELVNVSSDSQISTIQIQAFLKGSTTPAKTWDLFSGEMTHNQGSYLLHPVIATRDLAKGEYLMRVEVALASGDLLLSEAPFVLN